MVVQIWNIGPGDTEAAERMKAAYDSINRNPPRGYRMSTYDPMLDFVPESGWSYFVAGHGLDRPVGYAFCKGVDPKKDVGKASCLFGLGNGRGLKNRENVPVDRSNLGQQAGYSRYTGQGGLLHLATLEVWVPAHSRRLIRGAQE